MLEILGSHGMVETNPRTKLVREEKNGNGTNGVPFDGGVAIVETPNHGDGVGPGLFDWRASDSP